MSSDSSDQPGWTADEPDWLRNPKGWTNDQPGEDADTSGDASESGPATAPQSGTAPQPGTAPPPWPQAGTAPPPWPQAGTAPPPWPQAGNTAPPPQDPWAQPQSAPPGQGPWGQPQAGQQPGAYPPPSPPDSGQWPQQPFQQAGSYPPGPGPYGPYQPQYYGQGIPRNNPCAVAALICGIGQFVLGLLVIGNILLAIPAIICGAIGLRQIARRGERGRGLAIAGLVLGIAGVLYFLVVIVLLATTFHVSSNPPG